MRLFAVFTVLAILAGPAEASRGGYYTLFT